MDEGCGKERDLGAMMSVADGIIRMEIKGSSRIINVVKHPKVRLTRAEVPIEAKSTIKSAFNKFRSAALLDPERMGQWVQGMSGQVVLRREVGDFVNLFWPQFAHCSTMLWDPKGFPTMIYELNKEAHARSRELIPLLRWHMKLIFKLFMPKSLSEVKDMKRFSSRMLENLNRHGYGTLQSV